MQVRNTAQRKIILDLMKDNLSHPTAEEIYEAARSIDGHISRGTVYRNLGFLSDTGEILKIRVHNGSDHYDCSLHQHHQFCCDGCSRLFDVPDSVKVKASKISGLLSREGFTLNSHNLIFTGLCPDCSHKNTQGR